MKTSDRGIALIKKYEGLSLKPYQDAVGLWTIGYGHLILDHEKFYDALTEKQAEDLLKKDLIRTELAVDRLISVPLTQSQFDALVSFTFNLGAGALNRSTLRAKINRREYASAAAEFDKWVFAGGIKFKGLVARREAEKQLFLS
jgi:lysozyme